MSTSPIRSRRARALAVSALAVSLVGALAGCGAGEKAAAAADPTATAASADGVQQAKDAMATWAAAPQWPDATPIAKPVDLTGKKFTFVALGDQIPVIHGVGVGVTEALAAAGAEVKICDGKFNPTAVADCLKAAGDEKVDGVISAFVDYQMAGPAFDALAAKGVKVIVGGVAPSGDAEAGESLAFYDNTPRVFALHESLSNAAIAEGGADTNVLWVRLMDSTTTTGASAKGIETFKKLCPSCGIAETEFTTANVDKLATSISAALVSNPDTNAVIVPGRQLRAPGAPGHPERQVRRQGQGVLLELGPRGSPAGQGRPAGRRPRHPGALRGLEVRQRHGPAHGRTGGREGHGLHDPRLHRRQRR